MFHLNSVLYGANSCVHRAAMCPHFTSAEEILFYIHGYHNTVTSEFFCRRLECMEIFGCKGVEDYLINADAYYFPYVIKAVNAAAIHNRHGTFIQDIGDELQVGLSLFNRRLNIE